MDKQQDIRQLFEDYLNNQCEEKDFNRLFDYFGIADHHPLLRVWIAEELAKPVQESSPALGALMARADRRILSTIAKRSNQPKGLKAITPRWHYLGYAAALIACICTGILLLSRKDPGLVPDDRYGYRNDVLPGMEKAYLLLSDGKKLVLDSTTTSIFGDNQASRLGYQGKSPYQSQDTEQGNRLNTLIVPKGGTHSVELPDGSKVRLNAYSELQFPEQFSGAERRVSLKGEAFFEIKTNPSKPFKVVVGDQVIEVIGTSFNVKSYHDKMTTTLVTGSIRLINKREQLQVKPGQEVIACANEPFQVRSTALMANIAWTKGDFSFEAAPITAIMEDIGRWYNVELIYKGTPPNKQYTGGISRNARLSDVLEMLKTVSGANFEINKRKLYVDFGLK